MYGYLFAAARGGGGRAGGSDGESGGVAAWTRMRTMSIGKKKNESRNLRRADAPRSSTHFGATHTRRRPRRRSRARRRTGGEERFRGGEAFFQSRLARAADAPRPSAHFCATCTHRQPAAAVEAAAAAADGRAIEEKGDEEQIFGHGRKSASTTSARIAERRHTSTERARLHLPVLMLVAI